jgi:hypothetical protein
MLPAVITPAPPLPASTKETLCDGCPAPGLSGRCIALL